MCCAVPPRPGEIIAPRAEGIYMLYVPHRIYMFIDRECTVLYR